MVGMEPEHDCDRAGPDGGPFDHATQTSLNLSNAVTTRNTSEEERNKLQIMAFDAQVGYGNGNWCPRVKTQCPNSKADVGAEAVVFPVQSALSRSVPCVGRQKRFSWS